MTSTTNATKWVANDFADELMQLGSELPEAIAGMDTLQRYTTVGVLAAAGYIPDEHIATELLFRPQYVLLIPKDVFEQGRAKLDAETTPETPLAEWERELLASTPDDGGFLSTLATELSQTGSVEYPRDPSTMTEKEMDAEIISLCAQLVADRPEMKHVVTELLDEVGLEFPSS